MKVYLVVDRVPYEGMNTVAIFNAQDLADTYADHHQPTASGRLAVEEWDVQDSDPDDVPRYGGETLPAAGSSMFGPNGERLPRDSGIGHRQ